VAKPSTEPSWVAETLFSGVIAELQLPRRSVERLLPPELCLGPAASRRRTVPVLVAFGNHTGSAVHMAAMQVRTGVSFHEVFFGVRCLIATSRTPVMFVPLMYCDEPVSTWSGNALYGFNKTTAAMEWLGGSFLVEGEDGRVILRATIDTAGAMRAGMPRCLEAAKLRVLGRRRQDGAYAESRFAWEWVPANVTGVRVMVAIEAAIAPGIEPGDFFASPRSAALVTDLRWRISWPNRCHVDDQEGDGSSCGVTVGANRLYTPASIRRGGPSWRASVV
jgi:hypothetical protein